MPSLSPLPPTQVIMSAFRQNILYFNYTAKGATAMPKELKQKNWRLRKEIFPV